MIYFLFLNVKEKNYQVNKVCSKYYSKSLCFMFFVTKIQILKGKRYRYYLNYIDLMHIYLVIHWSVIVIPIANLLRGITWMSRVERCNEEEGVGVAQGCKTPWNYQQSLPSPEGWAVERTLSTPRPRNYRPGGYLSCLLVYEIQHCYLAPHRGVRRTVWLVVSGEFPTLKGYVHDYVHEITLWLIRGSSVQRSSLITSIVCTLARYD